MTASKYFKMAELACKCCGKVPVEDALVKALDAAREAAGVPFVVTSGYRCQAHNRAVGGKDDSAHTEGQAVDIATPTSDIRLKVIQGAVKAGFKRIGIAKTFVHLDVSKTLPQPVCWLYKD